MMGLEKRKELAAKVLGVGKNKILFSEARLSDIKEAITKQDIRDMYAEGIIMIKSAKGRKKKEKRTTKRGPGKIKMTVRNPKREYIILVRKFRRYIGELRKQGKVSEEQYRDLRKKIKAKMFKSKANLKDFISGGKLK